MFHPINAFIPREAWSSPAETLLCTYYSGRQEATQRALPIRQSWAMKGLSLSESGGRSGAEEPRPRKLNADRGISGRQRARATNRLGRQATNGPRGPTQLQTTVRPTYSVNED